MQLTPSLLNKLRADFPDVHFEEGELFAWSPETKTVYFTPQEPHGDTLILHELSHSILGHTDYKRDVTLLAMETAAWEHAKTLASRYAIDVDTTIVEVNLDTYREWLHARSTCPECTATGYQTDATTYTCPACTHKWRVNEARSCALRRYRVVR